MNLPFSRRKRAPYVSSTQSDRPRWANYYDRTRNGPLSQLTIQVLHHVHEPGKALDIGAGSLRDARRLLELGFEVIALDESPLLLSEASRVNHPKLHPVQCSIENYSFPENEFIIVSGIFSLIFVHRQYIDKVLESICKSLTSKGVACFQLLGERDDWVGATNSNWHTQVQLTKLLKPFKVISINEQEYDEIVGGKMKHWHYYEVIAKRDSK